jgi:pimeloyl-ACP methyl ester carboxylesterase
MLPTRSSTLPLGHRHLSMSQYGPGPPLLVLEPGAGEDSTVWAPLLAQLLPLASICTYDRAGLGQSSPASRPRTLRSLVDDLAQVLAALPPSPPPILVGHSLGGLIVFHYAQCYPQCVGGLILLDALHPRYGSALITLLTRYAPQYPIVQDLLATITTSDATDHPEGLDIHSATEILEHAPALPAIPLHVISRGRSFQQDIPDFPTPLIAELDMAWRELQHDYVQQSVASQWTIADASGHAIPADAPHLVIDAVRASIAAGVRT